MPSKEEEAKIHSQLADEFVIKKKEKLNFLSKVYLWLHDNFVEQIMLKNDNATMDSYLAKHAKGGTETLSELE